ncbi:hypothetical protein [Actinokineospora sp. NBRC 105648]|uniref:hypothetical protein n=1 Tax=Actinokineospora sp. NBRC 105648 TaxID=3032206 RepID=UPI0024A37A01|nr:hypothetical protein [Actinokineospora sp. NBRC 105648]GLZ38530.1 hypothetical protein Acsp05_21540 [Actinokineospora sp. NBRC 105648]
MPTAVESPAVTLRAVVPVLSVFALALVAGLMLLVAPGLVRDSVYQVVFGGDDYNPVTLPRERLDCGGDRSAVTCTAEVVGKPLVVTLTYHQPGASTSSRCTATFDGASVGCQSMPGDYGHASDTAALSGDLGLTADQLAAERAALPWWRDTSRLSASAMIAGLVLALGAGVAAAVAGRVPMPDSTWRLMSWAAPAGWLLVMTVTAIAVEDVGLGLVVSVVNPFSLGVLALLWGWQRSMVRPGRGGPLARALVAFAVVAVVNTVTVFEVLLAAGFID